MFKKALRYFCYKIFFLGKIEYRLRLVEIRRKGFEKIAHIAPSANIMGSGTIINHMKNKELVRIGNYTNLQGELLIMEQGGSISIGDYCYIGAGSRIWSGKNIKIGNRVLISHNVNIHDNIAHPLDAADRHNDFLHIFLGREMQPEAYRAEQIVIGDDVWIGFNATILKGVNIGDGAVIGACTLVTKDVPPFSVVIGQSDQKIVKYLK